MRRRDLLSVIVGATTWPLAVRAQQRAMPVIGFLSEVPEVLWDQPLLLAFRQGLGELGWVEGKKVAIEYRFGSDLLQNAGELVRRNVSAIVAPTPATLAVVSKATTTIPVIGVDLESDPVAKGYAKSLARPGGNITGMFLDIPELSGKQVGLLKEIVPRLSRIAIFGIPGLNVAQFPAAETAIRALGLEAEIIEVRSEDDFEGAMEAARAKHAEAGILLSSPLVFTHSKQIGELALAKRLPLISLFDHSARLGVLVAYGPNMSEIFRRCGVYVAKILQGAKPSDLPIQRPKKFDLVINLKTATALGIDMPTQLQQLADEVIEWGHEPIWVRRGGYPAMRPGASPRTLHSCKHCCAPTINVKHKVDLHLPHSARCLKHHTLRRGANMPRFYFHLSAPDQDFPDNIGSDVSDLTAAHSIAVRLMKRVMMISSFADCAPDLRRWIVKVTDERGRPVFTVMFPRYFVPRGWKPFLVSGARALLLRLDAMNAVDDISRVRVPAPPPGAFEARLRTRVKR